MKLADTLIVFNNNSDVIMTSLIIKKRNWNKKKFHHLESAILNQLHGYHST